MATPSEIQSNLTDTIEDIEKLLNRWTFRNLTVYGRILVVKALALSKVTHLVQVIPNPSPTSILNLQRIINKFIWKGNAQKKVVVSHAIAELPEKKGGLAVPNLQKFWDSLKLAWLTRLIQGDESSTWKRLSLSKLSLATNIPNLTSKKLLSLGPASLAQASRLLNNQFWQSLFKLMPQLERTFYLQNLKIIGEKVIWNTDDLLLEGKPFDRKLSSVQISQNLTTISSFLSENTHVLMSENEAAEKLGYGNIPQWNLMVSAITKYLTKLGLTWYSVDQPDYGPNHLGWSRMVIEANKAKKYYPLLLTNKGSTERNLNEKEWSNAGLNHYDAKRWDNIYRNLSRLKCNKRVKYEEWRIVWGRQELNRYKDKYVLLKSGNSVACSYCQVEIENEYHLYVECPLTDEFWHNARDWFSLVFKVAPSLILKGPRLFGLEKEPPSDLLNIFYRNGRYCIFNTRKRRTLPSLKHFISLVRDELKLKYRGNRILKYADKPSEAAAIGWMRRQMG